MMSIIELQLPKSLINRIDMDLEKGGLFSSRDDLVEYLLTNYAECRKGVEKCPHHPWCSLR